MKIIEYIPRGHTNAVTRQELCRLTGKSDRVVREMIEHESTAEHPILNMQDGKGYFQPDSNEMYYVRLCILQNEHRAKAISIRTNMLKSWMKNEESEVMKNQLNIFDFI